MRSVGLVVVVWSSTVVAQPLAAPAPEVRDVPKLELPAIPSFEIPAEEPGFVSVQGLRVDKAKHLGSKVTVKGYVTWIYDCATAIAKVGETKAQTRKRIDDDPTQCERPKFYLGASPKEAAQDGLWVVSVPRAPNKLEKERLPKEELAAWPKVPAVRLGAFVAVTGQFAVRSPKGEANSDGLVVFEAMAPAKPTLAKKSTATPPARPEAPAPPPTTPPAKADAAAASSSIKLSNEGTRAYGQKQYVEAVAAYKKAVAAWPGNHVAWYGLAGAYIGQRNWPAARDAAAKAAEVKSDESMYHMVYGYTLYESTLAAAREAQAKKEGRKPEEIIVDTSGLDQSKALVHLSHAAKLEPRLWRAHYYIGRIHRDAGKGRWAAESFDTALRAGATDPGPWIALTELYRRWRYTDPAIAVARAGTAVISTSADLQYVLGMGHYDKRKLKDAIAAFTAALAIDPNHAKSLFQRGQAYFDTRAKPKAKADLEAFLAVAPPSYDFPKQQAQQMLVAIGPTK